MRANTLKDVHILFSSVIPLDMKPEATEIWRVAQMFGAKCHSDLSSQITHVVTAKVSKSFTYILTQLRTICDVSMRQ